MNNLSAAPAEPQTLKGYWAKLMGAILVIQFFYWGILSPHAHRPDLSAFTVISDLAVASIDAPTLTAVQNLEGQDWTRLDSWQWTGCCDQEHFVFRAKFTLDDVPEEDLGLITTCGADNCHTWINGYTFIQEGRIAVPSSYNKRTVGVRRVSRAMLQPGSNEIITITVKNLGGYTDARPLIYGDYEALSQAGSKRTFFLTDYRVATSIITGTLGLLSLVTAVFARNRAIFFWFGALAVGLALRTDLTRWSDPPVSPEGYVGLMAFVYALPVLAWFNFLDAWSGKGLPKVRMLLTIATVLIVLVITVYAFIDKHGAYNALEYFNAIFSAIIPLGAAGLLFFRLWKRPRQRYWEIALFTSGISVMAWDAADKFLPPWAPNGSGLNYIMPFLVLGFVAAVAGRNVRIFESMGALNAEIRERLTEAEREIKRRYRELHEIERARDIAQDRQRILRDVHDGIGNQLTGLLLEARTGKLDNISTQTGLESALNDLRLVVQSLDSEFNTLKDCLDALRPRLERQLQSADIQLQWSEADDLSQTFDTRELLHLSRILQEAITNAIRHSGASTVKVLFSQCNRGGFTMTIEDNGSGVDEQRTGSSGYGIRNMKNRARQLGGTVNCENTARGFRISINVPASVPEANEHFPATAD